MTKIFLAITECVEFTKFVDYICPVWLPQSDRIMTYTLWHYYSSTTSKRSTLGQCF